MQFTCSAYYLSRSMSWQWHSTWMSGWWHLMMCTVLQLTAWSVCCCWVFISASVSFYQRIWRYINFYLYLYHSLFNVHGVCHLVLISIRQLPVGQTVWLVTCTQEVTVHTMAVNSFKLCEKLSCIPDHCPAPLVSPSLLTSSYWPRRRNGQNRGRSG